MSEEAKEYNFSNMLVPVRHPDDVNRVTDLSSILAEGGRIVYLTVIKEGNFLEMQRDWRKSSKVLEKDRGRTTARGTKIIPKVTYSDSVWKGILDQAEEEDSDLIILGWNGDINFRSLRQKTPVERVFTHSNRDVIVFKNQGDGVKNIDKILFPVGYKNYDYSKRLSITSKIIRETGAECVLAHVVQEDETSEEVDEILERPKAFMKELGVECETKKIENPDVLEALIEESKDYDLMMVGPTREYVLSRYLFGWMTDELVNNAECSALIFKEKENKWKAWAKGVISGMKKEFKSLFTE